MHGFQLRGYIGVVAFKNFRIDPLGVDLHPVSHTAVNQRFIERLVRVLQADILSDHADRDFAFRIGMAVHYIVPARQIGVWRIGNAEGAQYFGVQPFTVILQWHGIDRGCVQCRNHGLLSHVTELRDLAPFAVGDWVFRPAKQDIGLDPEARQFAYRMLGRLRLQLTRRSNIGHEGDMHAQRLPWLQLISKLADGFHERQPFDIADSAADLTQDEIVIVLPGKREGLDLVRDVRNHLHRRAEIVPPPLFGDDVLIDTTGCNVVALMRRHPGKAFVMAQIQVRFRPIVRHIDFAMLIRGHRPWIDIEIGVELSNTDLVATRLEESSKRCCHETFAERGDHAAGDKYIPRHGSRALSLVFESGQAQTAANRAEHAAQSTSLRCSEDYSAGVASGSGFAGASCPVAAG